MRMDIAWWDLDGTDPDVDTMAARLRDEGTDAWAGVPGLVLKLWLSDRAANRWGAVMLWTDRPADSALPPNRAAELIGRPPTHRSVFEVGAAVAGGHASAVPGVPGTAPAHDRGALSDA
ncbi:hypothetical protein [Streptomyces sp. NPDC001744]|uniref:hypothetical protein n=1 Tax=Streptomyces sp. NPDC001744 TaxID=3364606 RepID=UPI0036BA04B8